MTSLNPPHLALALPANVAYRATPGEIAALYRRAAEVRRQEAAPAAAAPSTAASRTVPPLLAPAVPKVLSKSQQADLAVSYAKAHGVTVLQAIKTLGFAT